MQQEQALQICPNGHTFHKSSDCPVCPICEQAQRPTDGFAALLSAPARRALENNGISSLEQLSALSEADILKFHGMGKASLPQLRAALATAGLAFKIGK